MRTIAWSAESLGMGASSSVQPGGDAPLSDAAPPEGDGLSAGMVLKDDPTSLSLLMGIGDGKIVAAMPAHNEEQYIAKTILGAQKTADIVLVVDDGSSDTTVEIARALGALVVQHKTNRGYGGALQTIFSVAHICGADALVILDADGQHDPADISLLLAGFDGGADVVIGSRFLDGSKGDVPAYRKVGMRVLDTATAFAGDVNVSDSQSGFRAYSHRAVKTIRISGEGMSAGSEILIQAADAGLRIVEVPIAVRYDIEGTSSENPVSHGLYVLGNIVSFIGYRRPMLIFGIPGLVCVVLGALLGSHAFGIYYTTTKFPYDASILTVILMFSGMLLCAVALILNELILVVRAQGARRVD